MKTQRISLILLSIFVLSGVVFYFKSCQKPAQTPTEEISLIPSPDFKADSAFAYVKVQVDFGPRVPNTKAHRECGDYLISKLKQPCDRRRRTGSSPVRRTEPQSSLRGARHGSQGGGR